MRLLFMVYLIGFGVYFYNDLVRTQGSDPVDSLKRAAIFPVEILKNVG